MRGGKERSVGDGWVERGVIVVCIAIWRFGS